MSQTAGELFFETEKQQRRIGKAAKAVVECARVMVPVLRDSQHPEAAKELERLIFLYDAEIQEAEKFTREHMDDLMRVMLEAIKKERGNL